MPKTVITGTNVTTNTNAAVTDPAGPYVQTTPSLAHPSASGVVLK